jgi:hypothetical protein
MTNTSVSNVGVFLAASQESAYFRGWTDALITAHEEVRTMETCSGITAVEVRKDALKAIDVCKGFVALQVGADDEHLPECPLSRPRDVDCGCVCHLLRACEQRVEEAMDRAWTQTVALAVAHTRTTTLDAAREAVAALTAGRERMDYEDGPEVYGAHNAYIDCVDDALAAIDALRDKP